MFWGGVGQSYVVEKYSWNLYRPVHVFKALPHRQGLLIALTQTVSIDRAIGNPTISESTAISLIPAASSGIPPRALRGDPILLLINIPYN